MKNETVLYILGGPPGAGKTTRANQLIDANQADVVHELDEVRRDLCGTKAAFFQELQNNPRIGLLAHAIQHQKIVQSLKKGKSVVVSDQNIDPKLREDLYQLGFNNRASVFLQVLGSDESAETLLARNENRPADDRIPEQRLRAYISKFTTQLPLMLKEMRVLNERQPSAYLEKECVIIDIDDTLATKMDRGPFEYHKCDQDQPLREQCVWARDLIENKKKNVMFITGRERDYEEDDHLVETKSLEWLQKYVSSRITRDRLLMRELGDRDPSYIVKMNHVLDDSRFANSRISIHDDDSRVCQVFANAGHSSFQIRSPR